MLLQLAYDVARLNRLGWVKPPSLVEEVGGVVAVDLTL